MPSTNLNRKELFKLGSPINQRKIKFVKKSRVTNEGKSEEIIFLFIYYFKTLAQES